MTTGGVMEKKTIHALARDARSWFELAERAGRDPVNYWRVKDDAPEWVSDMCREAHGEFFPDDYRYALIVSALDHLSDDDNDPDDSAGEFADAEVDVYTGHALKWLASDLRRLGYCDEAAEEYGGDVRGIAAAIALGQYAEASETYALVVDFLRNESEVWS